MSRKAFTVAVVATTIAWSIGLSALLAPLSASAAASGSLVKASLPAVYYVGADGKRYVFPNEKTYKTWYSDFSQVQVITDAELAAMAIGGNVTYKPGVKMVKITTDPKVYAVDAHGTLRWVTSEAVAVTLYGASWNQMIEDVPDAFFTNYTIGSDVASASAFSPSGVSTAAASINVDKNLGAGGTVTGALNAMLSASQPVGGTLPLNATGVTMLKVDVRNSGSSAMIVDSMTVRRTGPGQAADFAWVYVYEGYNRLTTGRTINATSNEAAFSGLNLALAAGETKSLMLVADIANAPAALAGDVNSMQLVSMNAGTVAASGLPLSGPSFTLAGVAVGGIAIDKSGTISNPKAGQLGAKLAELKLSAGAAEDVVLNKVVLYYAGSVSRSNISNLVLKQAGLTVASVAGLNDKDQAVLVLASGFTMEKGNSRTFELYGDLAGSIRAGDTVLFYLDQKADLLATGQTYGYGVMVSSAAADVPAGSYDGTGCTAGPPAAGNCSASKVEAGQLTVTFNGPAAKDIAANAKDVELFNFTMAAAANLEVKKTALDLVHTGGLQAELDDLKITDVATGAVVAGPKAGVNATVNYDFTEVFNLSAGQARTFKVTADVNSAAVAGGKVTISLDLPTMVGQIRNLDNSTNLAAADFVPGTIISGNAHTIKKATATFSVASTPVAQTYIQGSQGVSLLGVSIKAGDASDIKVSSIKVTGYINADTAIVDFVQGQDYDDSDLGLDVDPGETATIADSVLTANLWDGSTQLGATKSPGAGVDGTMVFDNLNMVIGKGQTKSLVLKANMSSSIASVILNSDQLRFDIAAIGDVSVTDPDGNAIVAPDLGAFPVTGNVMTIKAAGTIAVALAPDDTESEAGIVVGNSSNVVLAKYKLTATDEELKLTKASLNVATAAGVISLSLYDGSTLIGGPAMVDGAGDAHFSGLNFVIPKDGSKVLTVKGNLSSVSGSGATTGSLVTVTLKDTVGVYSFEVRGTSAGSSTNIVAIPGGDKAGNVKSLRRSKPTVSVSIPNTVLSDGSKVVIRVTVAADAAGDIALGQIIVNSVEGMAGGTFGLNATPLVTTLQEVNGDFVTLSAATYAAPVVTLTLAAEKTIQAGTSKSFDIFMAVTGSAASDSVSTNTLTDAADATGTLAGLVANNFVWSDLSAVGHSLLTADWAAGWKVKGLTSPAVTMSK